jgi:hypothetical protein
MPTVSVNGTELYHEVPGTGPPVLLIMGATGDGGHFDALADLLADEFTVRALEAGPSSSTRPPATLLAAQQELASGGSSRVA